MLFDKFHNFLAELFTPSSLVNSQDALLGSSSVVVRLKAHSLWFSFVQDFLQAGAIRFGEFEVLFRRNHAPHDFESWTRTWFM